MNINKDIFRGEAYWFVVNDIDKYIHVQFSNSNFEPIVNTVLHVLPLSFLEKLEAKVESVVLAEAERLKDALGRTCGYIFCVQYENVEIFMVDWRYVRIRITDVEPVLLVGSLQIFSTLFVSVLSDYITEYKKLHQIET